jgi:hypothetical protein
MTLHYLLPCSCGQKVRVANSQAGGQVACACGKSLSVPTLRGLRELEFAPAEIQGPARPGWSPLHGALFSSGLLVATAGLVVLTLYVWRYTQLVGWTTDRSAEVVQGESAQIDTLTALQMLSAWSELMEEGLGERRTPIWVAAKEKIGEYRVWMAIGGGAFLGGALLSLATLFVGRPAEY